MWFQWGRRWERHGRLLRLIVVGTVNVPGADYGNNPVPIRHCIQHEHDVKLFLEQEPSICISNIWVQLNWYNVLRISYSYTYSLPVVYYTCITLLQDTLIYVHTPCTVHQCVSMNDNSDALICWDVGQLWERVHSLGVSIRACIDDT